MNMRSTSIAAIAAAGILGFSLTSCSATASTDTPSSATSAVASAAPTVEAAATPTTPAPLVRPDSVLLDLDGVATDPGVIEAYAAFENPNLFIEGITSAAEELIEVGLSFPELQKASHTFSAADVEVLDPLRPLLEESNWNTIVEKVSNGENPGFPWSGSGGVTYPNFEGSGEERTFETDDSGVSYIFKNEGMKIVNAPFENGALGVKIENISYRMLFTTADGDVVNVEMDPDTFMHFYLAEDGSWQVWDFREDGDSDMKTGISTTQKELDALPPL